MQGPLDPLRRLAAPHPGLPVLQARWIELGRRRPSRSGGTGNGQAPSAQSSGSPPPVSQLPRAFT